MPAPASPGAAGHVLPVAEVPVGALGLGVVVGGAAVVEVAEVGALGGGLGWARAGPPGPAPSWSLGLEF